MFTPQHITHLIRLQSLIKEWLNAHKQSSSLFNSLLNLISQRKDTFSLLTLKFSKENSSSSFTKPILSSTALELLIYKQSREIEKDLSFIQQSLQEFQRIMIEMEAVLTKSMRVLALKPPVSSTSSNQNFATTSSSGKKAKNKKSCYSKHQKPPKSNSQKSLSNVQSKGTLDDNVTDIPITLASLYCVRIIEMYERELTRKRNLINVALLNITGEFENHIKIVADQWEVQPHLNFRIEEEMMDRVKIWERAKEYSNL
ncbi:hypothetical protein G9A89_013279 [Geosiphon pyriformis]|nr:hypothetical protein G9A89_013279 [Geosiphon pyriformis]